MTGEVKPGGVRFLGDPALNLEESAGASRSWLRGVHVPCKCGGSGIGKNPMGGLLVDLAEETVTMGRRKMSENRERANLL